MEWPRGAGSRMRRAFVAAGVLGGLALVPWAGTTIARTSTGDPPANIYPNPPFFEDCSPSAYDDSAMCVNATVQAIDNARSQEGVGPMGLPSNWSSLTPEEQLFVATNLERTARGLAPLSGMATRLDQAAAQAASQGQDASVPSDFPSTRWTSNWDGGTGNPLESVYFWMYYDGPGSNNTSCQSSGGSTCWIHRHNVLVALACQPCVMGTGFSPTGYNGGTSWDEVLADTSGSPAMDYSWSDVVPYLPSQAEAGSTPSSPATPAASANDAAAPPPTAPAPSGSAPVGHRMVEATGGVFDFGQDPYEGSLPGLGISVHDIIGMAATADRGGYWLVGSDGGMFAFGDAGFDGSVPGTGNAVDDIVGFAATPDGGGYWMVGSDGGMFSFGDATYHGSVPALGHRVDDIVGFAATPDGGGYWMAGRNGEVWAFGDATFLGSPAASGSTVSDIVGIAADPAGGFWLVGSDGGVFGYGAARYLGSVPGAGVSVNDIVAIAPTPGGGGYWIYGGDGGVFCFGDARYFGSLPGLGIHVSDIRSGTGT